MVTTEGRAASATVAAEQAAAAVSVAAAERGPHVALTMRPPAIPPTTPASTDAVSARTRLRRLRADGFEDPLEFVSPSTLR
jgi:hypothetical protein